MRKPRIFFLLDFETTALVASEGEPIQASVRLLDEDLRCFYSVSTLLLAEKPELIKPPEETVHKISRERLCLFGWNKKDFMTDIFFKIERLLEYHDVILSGHNVVFDRNFLIEHTKLSGVKEFYESLPVFDTLDLSRMLLLGPGRIKKAKLTDVATFIGMNFSAHDAHEDTAVCVAFMRYLKQHASKQFEAACQGGYMAKLWSNALSAATKAKNDDLREELFAAHERFRKEDRFEHKDAMLIYHTIKG